jgi:hypothetical protein
MFYTVIDVKNNRNIDELLLQPQLVGEEAANFNSSWKLDVALVSGNCYRMESNKGGPSFCDRPVVRKKVMAYERPSALSGCRREGHAEGWSNLPLNNSPFPFIAQVGKRREGFPMSDGIDYKAVLEDLKARKAKLEVMIEGLESLLGTGGLSESSRGMNGSTPKGIEADTFIGLNILQAAERYLQMTGRPAKPTEQIAAALNQGGLSATVGSVSTILRRSDKGDSPVTRVGRSLWGLASWYPNRPRRTRQSGEEAE